MAADTPQMDMAVDITARNVSANSKFALQPPAEEVHCSDVHRHIHLWCIGSHCASARCWLRKKRSPTSLPGDCGRPTADGHFAAGAGALNMPEAVAGAFFGGQH